MKRNQKIIAVLVAIGIVVMLFGIWKIVSFKPEIPTGTAGDVKRTAGISQIGLTAATSTACALTHSDGRDRIVTKTYMFTADGDITGTNANRNRLNFTFSVASSTSAVATTSTSIYYGKDITMATSSEELKGFLYASSTASGNTSTDFIWGSGQYILFKFFDGVSGLAATTSASMTGFCGVEYYLDM